MKRIDLVDHRLMVDGKQPTDAAKAITFEVELQGHLFCFVVVAERLRFRRIAPTADLTLIALAFGSCKSGFDLTRSVLAIRTNNHVKGYSAI